MKVMVVAPHPDDETIGCGGTLCIHAQRGDSVSVVFLTSGELGLKHLPRDKSRSIREAEAAKAARILSLKSINFLRCSDWTLGDEISKAARLLHPMLKKIGPALIYVPHPEDGHPDHQAAWPILRACFNKAGLRPATVRCYEVWTPMARHDFVQDISSCMARKLRALRAHKSQLSDFDYLRAVTGLNQYRGALAGKCRFAEVFSETTIK
jgi:LmbE family N-acetylglucosaminyl deacetylase